jgi:hypothetical protein
VKDGGCNERITNVELEVTACEFEQRIGMARDPVQCQTLVLVTIIQRSAIKKSLRQ